MEVDVNIQWKACQQILADNLTPSAYQTWFAPMYALRYEDGVLVLQVKSQFVVEYVEENYIDLLSKAIFRTFGQGTRLEYRVLIDSKSGAASTVHSVRNDQEIRRGERDMQQIMAASPEDRRAAENFDTQLSDRYTFDNFVAGETNKLARITGLAIAKQPGRTSFNPLFIYGGSGVGKTHLANAIGNQVRLLNPDKKVLYVSANTFKLQYMDAVQTNNITNFLNFYQSVDVLIVDDVQYLSGQHVQKTQDTFFHIFNYLQQMQKQLILTSDRSPLQLKDIEDRLLTRFKWGLCAEITRPDFQLRKSILRDKMMQSGIELSEDIVEFIAHNVRDNVRDLEGILASLMAYSTLDDREIDMALAEQVVARIVEIKPKTVSMGDILGAVCEKFNLQEKSILGLSRTKEIMQARHIAIYLCTVFTEHSMSEIGNYMGNRTHATAMHSANIIRSQISMDPVLRNQIHQLEDILRR